MTITEVEVAAGESLHEALLRQFPEEDIIKTPFTDQRLDPEKDAEIIAELAEAGYAVSKLFTKPSGWEGFFINELPGMVPDEADKQFIKILTPSDGLAPGISHIIDPSQGDEVGVYTLRIDEFDPNYGS